MFIPSNREGMVFRNDSDHKRDSDENNNQFARNDEKDLPAVKSYSVQASFLTPFFLILGPSLSMARLM